MYGNNMSVNAYIPRSYIFNFFTPFHRSSKSLVVNVRFSVCTIDVISMISSELKLEKFREKRRQKKSVREEMK